MEELIKIITRIVEKKGTCLLAIDGPCASGKTTFAETLAQKLDCNLFHADDFFLRPEQRTPERLAETGGNIDYERLEAELLIPLKSGKPFCYRPYDCGIQALGAPISIEPKTIRIIEGSYSLHPRFEPYSDLKLLLEIEPTEQKKRLLQRNPALYQRFLEEWIPMEERYFTETNITQRCDIRRKSP